MSEIDIDKLLSEESEDVKQEEVSETSEASAEAEDTKEDTKKLKAENERLRRATKTLNEKLKEKEKPVLEAKKEEQELRINDDDPATKLWDKRIEEKAKSLVAPIYEANFKRAYNRFLKAHPEYAGQSEEAKTKLRPILEAAKNGGKVEEEEVYESLERANASENWRNLVAKDSQKAESRKRAQNASAQAAAVSESSGEAVEDFTEEEREEAAKFGKDPATYRKALKTLQESTFYPTNI